uniref:KIB1-4 beta-propeller domain-containing protein n=1 Tax=Arundo donax TaxID=35708 RepID=A0A0A9FMF4_ARUDO
MSPPPSPKCATGATIPFSSSKHRRLAPHRVGSWASLPQDLVELIGWRVVAGDLLDYVRFRAVCTHWNSSTVHPRGRGLVDPRFHPRRWMMLSEGHGLYPFHPNLGGYVRFFNLSTGAFVRVHLPLFDDHVLLDSTDGLLLVLLHRDHDIAIRLLHPFTGDIAELPPLSSLLPQMEHYGNMSEDCKLRELRFYLRGVCAAVSVSAAGAITVMLALDTRRRVAHAMAGDQRWTLSDWKLPFLLASTMSFQGKLYAVSPKSRHYENNVHIWHIDPPQPNAGDSHLLSLQPARIIAECPVLGTMSTVHLVVYRLTDLICGTVAPITNIGEHALFLGQRALCVSSNKGLPSVLGNSITCSYRLPIHDPQAGRRALRPIEHYHLGNGTWSPAIPMDNPPASPYMLVHHIFTCCYRNHWNKGLMFHGEIRPDWWVKPNLWLGS